MIEAGVSQKKTLNGSVSTGEVLGIVCQQGNEVHLMPMGMARSKKRRTMTSQRECGNRSAGTSSTMLVVGTSDMAQLL